MMRSGLRPRGAHHSHGTPPNASVRNSTCPASGTLAGSAACAARIHAMPRRFERISTARITACAISVRRCQPGRSGPRTARRTSVATLCAIEIPATSARRRAFTRASLAAR